VCDAHIKKVTAFLIASCIPLVLSFFGIKDFIKVISFVGGVFLALEGIFIVTMWWKQADKNIFFYLSSLVFIFNNGGFPSNTTHILISLDIKLVNLLNIPTK